MEAVTTSRDGQGHAGDGSKFHVNIEGVDHDWGQEEISVPVLREIGGLPPDLPIEEIDLQTNAQRTLLETEVVKLRPGLGFAKKIKFQRG